MYNLLIFVEAVLTVGGVALAIFGGLLLLERLPVVALAVFALSVVCLFGGYVAYGHERAKGDKVVSQEVCVVQIPASIDRGSVKLSTSCGVYTWGSNTNAPAVGAEVTVATRVNGLRDIVASR